MKRMEQYPNGHERRTRRSLSRPLSVLAVLTVGLVASTCSWYEHPGIYYCDETNNCADVPTTVCITETNRCKCPNPDHLYCFAYSKCMTDAECFPDAGSECDAGGSGGGNGSGGGGGGQ
jgi:hypothetical protein